MRNIRPLESRLRDLIESKEYQIQFNKLKNEILSKRREESQIKIDFQKPVSWKSPYFYTEYFENSWRKLERIPLKEIQRVLKNGNINDHSVVIPEIYSLFKDQWRLEYFFDPGQSFPKGFNPFKNRGPITLKYSGPQEEYDPYKVLIEVDTRHPLRILERQFKKAIRLHKTIHKQKERRRERYLDDEFYEVKKLYEEGLSGIEIFRKMYPEFKSFIPTKDYVENPNLTLKEYDGWATYKRVLRMLERVKEGKLTLKV